MENITKYDFYKRNMFKLVYKGFIGTELNPILSASLKEMEQKCIERKNIDLKKYLKVIFDRSIFENLTVPHCNIIIHQFMLLRSSYPVSFFNEENKFLTDDAMNSLFNRQKMITDWLLVVIYSGSFITSFLALVVAVIALCKK